MNSLFNHAVKQSQLLKKDLETFAENPATSPLSLQGQISATLTSFNRTLDDYQRAAQNELVPERKEKAKVRIENFKNEIQDARDRFKRLKELREESLHAENKQELFARRVHGGSSSQQQSENPYSIPPDQEAYANMTREEGLRNEGDVLSRVGIQLDQFIEQGQAALGDLTSQSALLQNSRQTMFNVASTLGMSNETIRMVERRALQDKWIFYGGVLFLFVCFWYILKWLS